jgi:hypothetical protein
VPEHLNVDVCHVHLPEFRAIEISGLPTEGNDVQRGEY